MYTAEDIQARLRHKLIGSPSSENHSIYDRVTRVALVHVVALEELPVSHTSHDGQA